MNAEVAIKEEPLDWGEADGSFDWGRQNCNMQFGMQNQKRDRAIKKTNTIMADQLYVQSSVTAFNNTAVSEHSENIITVNVAESVKTEDEISFIKQVIAEENQMHDPALIIPTDLEIYAKGIKSKAMEEAMKNSPLHKCRKQCDRVFKTLTERALHETHEHKIVPRYIKCNFCHETFENFFALTRHMSEHRNEQRYVCSHCSKNFNSYFELQTHWKVSDICKGAEEENKNNTDLKQSLEEINTKASDLILLNNLLQRNASVSLIPKMSSSSVNAAVSSPQQLSYAEEVKAFAAKYQLKTARKRTSAITLKPIHSEKKRKIMNIDVEANYAVPTVINNFNGPLQDLKIKEEPIDDEEMATTVDADFIDSFKIKNEPHDDYEDLITKNLILSDETSKSHIFDESTGEISDKNRLLSQNELTTPTKQLNSSEINKNGITNVKIENDINGKSFEGNLTMRSLDTIITANQQHPQPHPKILLSKANILSMKNVKILKLGPLAKIVKLTPPLTQAASSKVSTLEENELKVKEQSENPFNFNKSPSSDACDVTPTKSDIDTMPAFTAVQIKVEPTLEFPPFQEDSDDKSNVMLSVTENFIKNSNKTKRNLPKWLIRYMEEQPQKRKIIDDLQRQFQTANEIMNSTTPTASTPDDCDKIYTEKTTLTPLESKELVNPDTLPLIPESFFLKVTDDFDKELMKARRQYRNYYYAWICPMCYKEYTHKHTFINHLIGTHKISTDKLKTFTVEVKPLLVSTVKPEQNLSSIKKRKSKESDANCAVKPQFECPKCKRIYFSKQAVIDHEISDCGRLPLYVCTVCAKPFSTKSTLSCHMTIHTGELPYKCKYCDKRFRTNGQVRVHHRKHTGEKPFTCQICSLSFTHRETLISHLSRHMDIKRYICKGCNKRFSTISALTTHRNVRPTTCGTLELDTQAVGPLIRVTNGQVSFEPQRVNNGRARRKLCQEILTEIQNIPKNNELEHQEQQNPTLNPPNES